MKFTTNSALTREYSGASKEMLDNGFEVLTMAPGKLNQTDLRLGRCDDWELRCQDWQEESYDD